MELVGHRWTFIISRFFKNADATGLTINSKSLLESALKKTIAITSAQNNDMIVPQRRTSGSKLASFWRISFGVDCFLSRLIRYRKCTCVSVPKGAALGLKIGRLEHDVRRLEGFLESLPVEIESFAGMAGYRTWWPSFLGARSSGEGRRVGSAGYGFRIEFPEMVQGPVAVGYRAHFGMGGFWADEI